MLCIGKDGLDLQRELHRGVLEVGNVLQRKHHYIQDDSTDKSFLPDEIVYDFVGIIYYKNKKNRKK
jgi:hypothetical protein